MKTPDASKPPYLTLKAILLKLLFICISVTMLYFLHLTGPPGNINIDWLHWILVAQSWFLLVVSLIFPIVRFSKSIGNSMLPTMKDGDYQICESISKLLNIQYKRGNIVCFMAPDLEKPEELLFHCKRIVALPGETILIQDGRLFVDGKMIDEPWNTRDKLDYDLTIMVELGLLEPFGLSLTDAIVVPENHYFVLGDNRNVPEDQVNYDSRFLGFIPYEHIHEKVVFNFYM